MSRRIITIVAIFVIVFSGGLSAILINAAAGAFRPVSTVPHTTLSVSGNGGNAVAVGNYLYFIGNFVPINEITYRQNEYNRVVVNERQHYGGIYRIPLGGDRGAQGMDPRWSNWIDEFGGQGTARPIYDNNHLEMPHDDINMNWEHNGNEWNTRIVGKELIVPKIAGFENSAIWVFGNHLVYTSPHNRLNRFGQLQTGRLDFFRVDLDGRNHRLLFTTETAGLPRENFTVAWANDANGVGQSHLLMNDGGRLVHVGVSANPGRVTEIAQSVTSFALPMVTSYSVNTQQPNKGFGGLMNYVYWTENRPEEDAEKGIRGNLMKRFSLSRLQEDAPLGNDPGRNYRIQSLSGGLLFFEIDNVLMIAGRGANEDNRDLFTAGSVFQNFRALDLFQAGERFFAPTEFNTRQVVFSQSGTRILRYTWLSNPVTIPNDRNPGQNRLAFDSVIAEGVDEIIAVTPNQIIYRAGTEVVTIDHAGNRVGNRNSETGDIDRIFMSNREEASRVTHFRALPHSQNEEFFFYIRTLTSTEVGEETTGEDGEITEGARETKTVAVMVDRDGRSWILAVLEDEFI